MESCEENRMSGRGEREENVEKVEEDEEGGRRTLGKGG